MKRLPILLLILMLLNAVPAEAGIIRGAFRKVACFTVGVASAPIVFPLAWHAKHAMIREQIKHGNYRSAMWLKDTPCWSVMWLENYW